MLERCDKIKADQLLRALSFLMSKSDRPLPRTEAPLTEPQKEYWQMPGVHSFLEKKSARELRDGVMVYLQAIEDPSILAQKLKSLSLPPTAPTERWKEALDAHVERYRQGVEKFRHYRPQMLKKLDEWLQEQRLTPLQDVRKVPVFVTDHILGPVNRKEFPISWSAEFDGDVNSITVQASNPTVVMDHEHFHAISHQPGSEKVGFLQKVSTFEGEGQEGSGSQWLNEGVTVMGEMVTSPKNARRQAVGKGLDMYLDGFLYLTQLFQMEVGFSEQDLFRAYLQEGDWRAQLESATQRRFGCGTAGLSELMFGFNEVWQAQVRDILQGKKPVTLTTHWGPGVEGRVERYKKLQEHFPLIELKIE
jgi:hypothetical protein